MGEKEGAVLFVEEVLRREIPYASEDKEGHKGGSTGYFAWKMMVRFQTTKIQMLPSNSKLFSRETYDEDVSSLSESSKITASGLLEQLNATRDTSDYLWYITRGNKPNIIISVHEERVLLRNSEVPEAERNLIQKAISQTFQSTAHLANLLPTGTVLAFQLLSPIFSNIGNCDSVSKTMTAALVSLCAASCFLLCLTDSFRDNKGNICYGFATLRGLWVIDGSTTLPPQLAAKYCLKFIDIMHAVMSVLVFAAIALFDQNVLNCFFPAPSTEIQEILTALPMGIGVFGSMFFVVFPTQRHGIGFPLSTN